MRRLEAIEFRNPVSVNQVGPTSPAGYTYCQAMNHVFEECPVFMAHQILPKHTNATLSRPTNNPYSSTYNPGWRNHPNFSWAQKTNDYLGSISPKIFNYLIINPIFPIKLHNHPSKIPLPKRPILRKF